MKPKRRRLVLAVGATLVAPPVAAGLPQLASRPRLLVGFPPGDAIERVAQWLAEAWRGRFALPVAVESWPGAEGRIAVSALREAAPDGLAMLLSPASVFTLYPHAFRHLAYNAEADLLPVAGVCRGACALVAGPAVPLSVYTLSDFVAWVRAHRKLAAYASPASGSVAHWLGHRFGRAAGLAWSHVGYRGAAAGLEEVMGGQIAAGLFALGDCLSRLGGGKLRLLALGDSHRSSFAPELPTFAEQGYVDALGVESYGVFVRSGTPPPAIDRLADLSRAALREPGVVEALAKLALEPMRGLEPYARQLSRERESWTPIVSGSGFDARD